MKGDHGLCECCRLFFCLIPDACTCGAAQPKTWTADGYPLCDRCTEEAFEAQDSAALARARRRVAKLGPHDL